MRPLIVTEFVTLDGVMEAPGGEPSHPHSGWVGDYAGPEQTAWKLAEVREAGALLLGRVTYEGFAAAWPAREGEFADVMNSIPKHVVTSTLADPLEWSNATVLGGDLAEGVGRLKAADGGPVLVAGSGTLVHALIERDLVDELRLMVFPVIVGGGLRVFPEDLRKAPFEPAGAETFASGVTVQTYRRPGA